MNLLNTPGSTDICEKCGSFCCNYNLRVIPVEEGEANPVQLDYFLTRAVDHQVINDKHYCIMNQQCPHLKNNKCSIYKVRPKHCAEFPQRWDEDWTHFCELMNKMYKGE